MSQQELTQQDLRDLIKAVECWETKGTEGKLIGMMLTGMMARDEEQRKEFMRKEKEEARKEESSRQQRKYRSITLRAKLIQILDGMSAEAFLDQAAQEGKVTA